VSKETYYRGKRDLLYADFLSKRLSLEGGRGMGEGKERGGRREGEGRERAGRWEGEMRQGRGEREGREGREREGERPPRRRLWPQNTPQWRSVAQRR